MEVSVAELGFKKGAARKDIYAKAKEYGLEPCPAEVGPQLRRQYEDQPNGEWIFIAMDPISDSDGNLSVFHVNRGGGGQWLDAYCGHPGDFWHGDDVWCFVRLRRRK